MQIKPPGRLIKVNQNFHKLYLILLGRYTANEKKGSDTWHIEQKHWNCETWDLKRFNCENLRFELSCEDLRFMKLNCENPRSIRFIWETLRLPWDCNLPENTFLWNTLAPPLNLPQNSLQSFLKHPWKFLETPLKLPSNTMAFQMYLDLKETKGNGKLRKDRLRDNKAQV